MASELLTNGAIHASASSIELRVGLTATLSEREIAVLDDGVGGATAIADHGVAGLNERLRCLGGKVAVDSPIGGPTAITVILPVS